MRLSLLIPTLALALTPLASAQYYNDYDVEPHGYFTKKLNDPVTLLMDKVDAGEMKLDEPNGKPLVERLLKELNLDKGTQTLVFSKTSLQKRAVAYDNPRAIYFNDSVYLGWMPNGRIEIASFDPELGAVFYFQRRLEDKKSRLLARTRSCLGCHAGSATNYLPGPLGLSVYPDSTSRSMRDIGKYHRSGHQIPLNLRWGGWFVSGQHGDIRHMGNTIAERKGGKITIDRERNANKEKLNEFFDTKAFPAPGSDVAALLVFDHQVTMHHEIVEAAYRSRQALFDCKLDPQETDVDKLDKEINVMEFEEGVEWTVDYLLFREEVELESPVKADPEFERAFYADRRQDKKGRSLKDLRLDGHIFKHRCSYMIYSPSFTALPPMMKKAIYDRLHEILTAEDPVEGYEYLPAKERQAIFEILRDTVSDLPANWKK